MVGGMRSLGCLAALLAGLPAQAPRKAPRHDAAAFSPTTEGTRWVWEVTTTLRETATPPGRALVGCTALGEYLAKDGVRWALLARESGETAPRYEHLRNAADGIYRGSAPIAATRELATPVGVVPTWEQVLSLPRQDQEDGELRSVTTVLDYGALVVVPAGVFTAVHLRCTTADGESLTTTDSWWVRNRGLVRRRVEAEDRVELHELREFTPGRDRSEERSRLLQLLAPPDWHCGPEGSATVRWFDEGPGAVAFGGRFALVEHQGVRRVAFVGQETVREVTAPRFDWHGLDKVLLPARSHIRDATVVAPRRGWMLATHGRLQAWQLGWVRVEVDDADDHLLRLRGRTRQGTDDAREARFDWRDALTTIVQEPGAEEHRR